MGRPSIPPLPLEVPSLWPRGVLEVHHVVKRGQGGSDFDLDRLVALCPPCHAQTDAPYARGRLVITPLGNGRFTVEVTQRANKWEIRASPPVPPRA
jgi:5-methylcytosine-specific restriction endonuclease McrA